MQKAEALFRKLRSRKVFFLKTVAKVDFILKGTLAMNEATITAQIENTYLALCQFTELCVHH